MHMDNACKVPKKQLEVLSVVHFLLWKLKKLAHVLSISSVCLGESQALIWLFPWGSEAGT